MEISHKELMLATPGKLFSAPGWLYELKYDGFRCLVCKRGQSVRLRTRNGNDLADRFPELVADIHAVPHDLSFDGELVILDELGRPQWDRLRKRQAARASKRVQELAASEPAAIFGFDLLWVDGEDYRHFPLTIRKAMLTRALRNGERVRCVEHFEGSCRELWQLAVQLELEGIVAKRSDSTYSAGRSNYWQKVKTDVGAERERLRRP